MSYWACARVQMRREALAVHSLGCAGFRVYLPRVRERKRSYGRWIERQPVLFPGYLFVEVVTGWWQARWCPGVLALIMDHDVPAKVPPSVLDGIRSREVRGLVELPPRIKRGDRVRILQGPFRERLALYQGQAAHERVAVLLALLGGQRRLELPRADVEPL